MIGNRKASAFLYGVNTQFPSRWNGGVSYCIGIEKYDENIPISVSAKRMLMSMNVTSPVKNEINVVRINDIENELQRLCDE